jgi:radical SAM protein with 4Fe4S-binding SPASM domain
LQDFVLHQAVKSFTPRRFWNVVKSVSGFAGSILLKRPVVWGIPPVITIEPTNYCNLDCPLCVTGSGKMTRSGGRMEIDMFRKLIDEVGDTIWYVIFYHQGEPYLNKAFLPAVRYAKDQGLYTETSTNAHYLDPRNCECTIQSGLDAMIVSLDGTTQESYEKYRVRGKLEKVLNGIRNLVEAKKRLRSNTPYILLQFLVMRHNEHQIPEIKKLAQDLEVDRLLLKNIQVETYQEALEWMPKAENFQRYEIGEKDISVRKGGRGICPRPWLSSLVNWDGTVVPCCFDKNGHHSMGDIANGENFVQVWSKREYNDFRDKMLNRRSDIDICRNCNQGFGVWV